MDKKQLRKELVEKRKNIPKNKKLIYDKEISRKIIESDYFKNAEQVLVFASVGNEFDTNFIIEKCRMENKSVFYPLCIDNQGKMKFFRIDSPDDLKIGMYNIPEPKSHCDEYSQKENDLIIVPCLSVDKKGYRIGYGKGYYDRFLKEFCGISICPCYDELTSEKLPTDDFDIKINVVVTQHTLEEVIL